MPRSASVRLIFTAVFLCACNGDDDSSTPAAQSQGGNGAPAVWGTPVSLTWEGEVYTFEPQASDPDSDALSFKIENRPRWAEFDAATGRLHGTPTVADVGIHPGIRIGASDGAHEVWLPPFDLIVDPVSHGALTLTWTPPLENTDDSRLDDLAAFGIYWATDGNELEKKVTVSNAGITSYFIDGLTPGKYRFATTAVNSFGIESELSERVIIVVR